MIVRTEGSTYEIVDGCYRRLATDGDVAPCDEGWQPYEFRTDVVVGRPIRFFSGNARKVQAWTTSRVVSVEEPARLAS